MTVVGEKLLEAAREAVRVARGEIPAHRIYQKGHYYVPEDRWELVATAPRDTLVMLAAEWPVPGSGDWRMKVGGWREDWGKWEIFGASWEPTHWQSLPSPPSNG